MKCAVVVGALPQFMARVPVATDDRFGAFGDGKAADNICRILLADVAAGASRHGAS